MKCLPIRSISFALSLMTSQALLAHEFWIQPDDLTPLPNTLVHVHLMVGDGFPGEAVARNPEKLLRLAAITEAGEVQLPGRPGADPTATLRVGSEGVVTLVYRSNHSSVSLEAEKFEEYLRTDGLEHVSRIRAERGESGQPGREIYSRCAKSLLRVGTGLTSGFDRSAGLTLELTPIDDPFAQSAGSPFTFRLTYEGRPLENALVCARRAEDPTMRLAARSDASGKVTVTLPSDGTWMISSVHMVEASGRTDADWESIWTSLTFELSADRGDAAGLDGEAEQ